MDAGDGHIQVPVDQGGKRVDTTEVTRADTGIVVERQRFEARDEDDNTLSTKEIVDQLKETNQLLLQIMLILQAANPFARGTFDG